MESWHAYNADGPRIFKNWSITDGTRKIATVAEQPTTEAEHAHARLIAAAPELLAALETAESALADALEGGSYWRENAAEHDLPKIRAAIAKAIGN